MRDRICKRCSEMGEWRKCRLKNSKYYRHYLCGRCNLVIKTLVNHVPKGELAKRKIKQSRRIEK